MILLELFGLFLLAELFLLGFSVAGEMRRRDWGLKYTVKARAHLMRLRFRSRLSWAPFASFIVAVIVSVLRYGGWGGFRGVPIERELGHVLLEFPIFWAFTFAVMMLNPFRSGRFPEP